jgi:hypothetical protein
LCESRIASGFGSAAIGCPGARTRFGPAKDTGEQRAENTGSVSSVSPGRRSRKLECPMNVSARCPGGTSPTGGG